MNAKVKIEKISENYSAYNVYIDGKKVKYLSGLNFELYPDCIPTINLEIAGDLEEFEGDADVGFYCSRPSLIRCLDVLKYELMDEGEIYHDLIRIIMTVLKDYDIEELPFRPVRAEIAKNILDRIVDELSARGKKG